MNPYQTSLDLVFYLGVFIIVIFIAIFGTKFIAKNYKGYSKSKYISFLDSMNLSGETKVVILEINGNIYILSVSANNTEIIDIINKDNFVEESTSNNLDKYTNKNQNNANAVIKQLLGKFKFSKDEEEKR